VVDWNKEMKFSDLVPGRNGPEELDLPEPTPEPPSEPAPEEAASGLAPDPQLASQEPSADEHRVSEPADDPPETREPEPQATELDYEQPEDEKTSFLKKEISFRRKPKPVEEDLEAEPWAELADEKPSFLKKEISFRRKPKPVEDELETEPADEELTDEKPSFLKKEISLSFRRKPKLARAVAEEEYVPEDDEEAAEKERPRRPRRDPSGRKRAKRLVGLKIGASQLAAARIVNNGTPELCQVARDDLEPGLVVGGELREPELLAEALRAFFRKHRLPRQNVRLGIANNRIGVRIFEIGGISDPRQLENAIRFRAQEALPIPIEEAVLDFHLLGERVDAEGNTFRRILLVVAYRELIDRYVSACKKAGIRLAGIDLEAFALLRALADPRDEDDPPSDAALVVVAIGHERSTFAVSDGRVCEFTRVLDWGGATLDVAIARELNVAPSEAAPFKRELSLTVQNVPEGLTQEQADAAREAVRRQLQTFARELVSSLQFYQNQPGSLGIGEIMITGGTAHLAGLADELQRLIGVRVAVGDPLTRVKLGRKVRETEQLGSLAVAIGLGIED
jgi:type IV pilus assembly protein PilM